MRRIGFWPKNRIFTPPVVSTVDADAAIAELDAVINAASGEPG